MPILRRFHHDRRCAVGGALALVVIALGSLVSAPGTALAQARLARESDLKAVFIFNFAQFTEWPAEAFHDALDPFVIGVIGNDPVAETLQQIVRDEEVRGRRLEVRHFREVRDIDRCHILFISASETLRLDRIFEVIRGKGILSVGETDEFLARDGIIRFLVTDHKLRLQINVEAAKAENLTISSKLLRQAEIVEAKREK